MLDDSNSTSRWNSVPEPFSHASCFPCLTTIDVVHNAQLLLVFILQQKRFQLVRDLLYPELIFHSRRCYETKNLSYFFGAEN